MTPIETWRRGARHFNAGGARIAYWTSGEPESDKPVLLLIHGYPTSSWDWTAIWPLIEKNFTLVALDMLGFGLSDKPRNHAYSISGQADLQEALLVHLGVGEAHVFAHDYGDTVAQELLARQAEKSLSFSLKSAVFLNGGLFPEQHRARMVQKLGLSPLGPLLGLTMSRARLRRVFDRIYGPETKAPDTEIDGHWSLMTEKGGARLLHRLLHYIPERKANRERWVGALLEASAPVRLIIGGADPVSGLHLFEYYLEQAASPDAVLLDNIGHYPHTEAPRAVADAFLAFHNALGTVHA